MRLKSAALTFALAATVGCGGASPGGNMKLDDEGYIKISGGCECYAEGLVTFGPAFGDSVVVEVDNSRGWFYEDNEPVESFKVKMEADEVAEFFEELKDVLDNPVATETCSTRAAVVEINLPFRDGAVETTWRELDMKQDVSPLVDLLEEFVEECHDEL